MRRTQSADETMFIAVALAILFSVALSPATAQGEEDIYRKIFDDVDVDSILNNDRILDTYLRCFFNTGPCSNLAGTMKTSQLVFADDDGSFATEDFGELLDDIDVDSILGNDRLLDSYLKCFFGTSHCTSLGEMIKGKIPEVFSTVCGMCTEKQKGIFKYSLNIFIPKRPDDWKHILEIYDPDGSYWPKIQEFLKQ